MNLAVLNFLIKIIPAQNCFKILKNRYSKNVIKSLNDIMKFKCQLTRMKNEMNFLNKCKSNGVVNKSTIQNIRNCKFKPTEEKCYQFLSLEISELNNNINKGLMQIGI